jgi:hypothetical protein
VVAPRDHAPRTAAGKPAGEERGDSERVAAIKVVAQGRTGASGEVEQGRARRSSVPQQPTPPWEPGEAAGLTTGEGNG